MPFDATPSFTTLSHYVNTHILDGRLRALAPHPPVPIPNNANWWNPAAALLSYWTGNEEKRGPSLGEPEYEVIRYNWLWRRTLISRLDAH